MALENISMKSLGKTHLHRIIYNSRDSFVVNWSCINKIGLTRHLILAKHVKYRTKTGA